VFCIEVGRLIPDTGAWTTSTASTKPLLLLLPPAVRDRRHLLCEVHFLCHQRNRLVVQTVAERSRLMLVLTLKGAMAIGCTAATPPTLSRWLRTGCSSTRREYSPEYEMIPITSDVAGLVGCDW
jgi:hypothetical protein